MRRSLDRNASKDIQGAAAALVRISCCAVICVCLAQAFIEPAQAQSTPTSLIDNASTPPDSAPQGGRMGGGPSGAAAMSVPGMANVSASGSFTYSIPIVVPPGSGGMVPSLSLDYSSSNGDGFEGIGWTLGGLPAITRCPRTIAQDGVHGGVNYDLNDRFCMNGQRLILISGSYGAAGSVYRTEIESFSQITAVGTAGNGPSSFTVQTKSGRVLYFGATTDSRVLAVGTTTAREWLVNQVADLKGNYFNVTYINDTTHGQAYPSEIDYTGNPNASPAVAPYNSVKFFYNTSRNDSVPTYQAGSLIQMTALLTNIKTYTGSSLVTNYELAYNPASSGTQHYELASVTRCDNSGTTCLVPTTFGWQGSRDALTMTATPNSLAQGGYLLPGDWNGDGLTDVLVNAGSNCNIYKGSQSGTFSPAGITVSYEQWTESGGTWTGNWVYNVTPCFGPDSVFYNPHSLDFSGDGFSDITVAENHGDGYLWQHNLLNSESGTLTQQSEFLGGVPEAMADFNGDGLTDLVSGSGSPQFIRYSNGNGTFTIGPGFPSVSIDAGDFDGDGCFDIIQPDVSKLTYSCAPAVATYTTPDFSTGTIVVGDFNGDGKDDILFVQPSGSGTLYLSTGTSVVASLFAVPSSWTTTNYQFLVGDFNGDGKTDLALISQSSGTPSTVFLSNGAGFVQAKAPDGSAISISNYGSATIADFNNDGAADIWLQSTTGDSEYLFSYVPELMTTVSNGLGATTTVNYDRLNHATIYTKGSGATYPTQDVINASYVVSSVSASNGVGGTNSVSYAYQGAKQDLSGRGFQGFTTVAATDSRTGIVATSNYNTAFPLTGAILSQTAVHGATTLSSITNTYTTTNLGGTRTLVELHTSAVARHDLDGTAYPSVTTTYSYDSYANATSIASTVSDGSSKTETRTFTNDTTNWILGQPLTDNVESVVGSSDLTRHMSFTSDPATGLVTSAIIEPSSSTLKLETDYGYDAFGNVTSIEQQGPGITARTSIIAYDTKGEFPTSASNALSQSESFAFDARFGTITSHTDINSQTTSWVYDTFGRPTKQTLPNTTQVQATYNYCSGIDGGTASCPTYGAYVVQATPYASDGTTVIGPYSTVKYDMLRRPQLRSTQGFAGTEIDQETVYDALLHVYQTSRPAFSGASYHLTTYTYDALDRVTQATFPDTSYTTVSYNALASTVTNAKGQATTTTLNAQGLVASVLDANSSATTYVYDAFGDATSVTKGSSSITNTFDLRGRKTASSDPDMGAWSYGYDTLSELTSQTDAKSQNTTLTYDLLGRPLSRTEADLTSTWTWDTATHGVGELASACTATSCASASYAMTPTYDMYGRPATETLKIDGTNYVYSQGYDSDGRLAEVVYPSAFRADYAYTSLSYLATIKDHGTGSAVWTANAADAELHLTQETAGNGVVTNRAFDADTGLVDSIRAGASNAIANFAYGWDTIGNLTSRADNNGGGYTEQFCYDNLNRLTTYALSSSTSCPLSGGTTVAYDALGNITSKTGVGTYTYGTGSAGPHAVTSIMGTVNGVLNPTYTYDANGNMLTGAGRSYSWTSFNMAATVTDGAVSLGFAYDTNHARIKQCVPNCTSPASTTYYLNNPVTGTMEEKLVSGAGTTWNDYIAAGGGLVAERSSGTSAPPVWGSVSWGSFDWTASPATSWLYFVRDHLGSIASITDATGSLISGGRQSYDAWGLRRNANGTAAACGTIPSSTTRGYTGQEMVDGVCGINLNARLYDPTIARTMSADTLVPNPTNGQSLNRYSYVNNGPLSATDPSGHADYEDTPLQFQPIDAPFATPNLDVPQYDPYESDTGSRLGDESLFGDTSGAALLSTGGGGWGLADFVGVSRSSSNYSTGTDGIWRTDSTTVQELDNNLQPIGEPNTSYGQYWDDWDTNGVNFGGLAQSLSYSGNAVDFIHIYSAGAIAFAMRGESAVSGIKVVGSVFGAMGGALVVGEQGADAAAEIQQGASPAIAVTGAVVNSAAIIGSTALSEVVIAAAAGAAFGGPVGAVVGVGAGIVVGYGLESYLTPTATGQFIGQQWNNLNAQSPWGGGM